MRLKIGEKICELRKAKGYTQEQLADQIGVTAPAVNKWEKENSYPDITLLRPLARILDTSLDHLLSYEENLSEEEIDKLTVRLRRIFEEEGEEKGYEACEAYLREYPTSLVLKMKIYSLYTERSFLAADQEVRQRYTERGMELLNYVAASKDIQYAPAAEISLASQYMTAGKFEEAKELIDGLPEYMAEKKTMYASIQMRQDRFEEAEAAYESILYKSVYNTQMSLTGMFTAAMKQKDYKRAGMLADAITSVGEIFQSGNKGTANHLTLAMETGEKERALDLLEKYVEELENAYCHYKDHPFFSRVQLKIKPEEKAPLMKMVVQMLAQDEDGEFSLIKNEPRYQKVLEKLLETT